MLLVRSVTRVDAALLDGTPVRFVGTATAGTDHVDERLLRARGIAFAAAPGCNARAVGEYVLATVLAHALLTARRSTAGSKVRSASDIDGQALAILKAAGYPLQPIGPTWRRLAEMDLKWASPEAYPLTPTRIQKLEGEAEGATRGPPTAQASGRAVRQAVPSVPGPWIVMWRDEGFQGSVD